MPHTAAQRVVSPKAAAQRTPTVIAIERLANLAGQGVAPHRLAGAAMDILADWRSAGVAGDELHVRTAALRADIEASLHAAEEFVGEAQSESARVAAAAQLEALVAVRKVLVAETDA